MLNVLFNIFGSPRNDPKFKEFKRNLPAHLHGKARALWNEVNKDASPEVGSEVRIPRIQIGIGNGRVSMLVPIVALTTVTELVAFLFPPYSTYLPQGLTVSLGFRFLFNPPNVGRIEVAVWGMEFVGILIIGALCLLTARLIERPRP